MIRNPSQTLNPPRNLLGRSDVAASEQASHWTIEVQRWASSTAFGNVTDLSETVDLDALTAEEDSEEGR